MVAQLGQPFVGKTCYGHTYELRVLESGWCRLQLSNGMWAQMPITGDMFSEDLADEHMFHPEWSHQYLDAAWLDICQQAWRRMEKAILKPDGTKG